MADTENNEQSKPEIVDINNMSVEELKALQDKRSNDTESTDIITDNPEEIREQQEEEAEPSSKYVVEIITKPEAGDDGIKVTGEQSVAKEEDGKAKETKPEVTYKDFQEKYPELKDKVDEAKFNEMFKVEAPKQETHDIPVELQKVTIDATDETAMTNRFDSAIKSDNEIKAILGRAGLKDFPKNEDEMDAFAEAFPRQYLQFERRQAEIAEDVTKTYVKEKEIHINAPYLSKRNIEDFGKLVEDDLKELYPNIEKDKDSLEKAKKAVLGFYATAKTDARYHVNVNGKLIPSKEKLYTGFTNSNRELYREFAQKGATTVAKAGDGKRIIEEIKKQVKNSPMTSLQDNVKSGMSANVKSVDVFNDNETTGLSLETLKAMQKRIRTKL